MAGMNGRMHKAGQGFALGPEMFMTLNEVEQRAKRIVNHHLAPAVRQTLAIRSHGLVAAHPHRIGPNASPVPKGEGPGAPTMGRVESM
jgi:hypothetical protein